jgi:hypothetical protein
MLVFVLSAACAAPGFAEEGEKGACQGHRWHWESRSEFAWQVQVDAPVQGLGRALDQRTGLGLGVQWTRDRTNGITSRTRLEWNTFPQGNPVGAAGLQTRASNYVLSFDRLYHFGGGAKGVYVLGGLGAVRWFLDETPAGGPTHSFHTTKLAVTGGAGYRFNHAVAAELRYFVSSVNEAYDGSAAQAAFSMRF